MHTRHTYKHTQTCEHTYTLVRTRHTYLHTHTRWASTWCEWVGGWSIIAVETRHCLPFLISSSTHPSVSLRQPTGRRAVTQSHSPMPACVLYVLWESVFCERVCSVWECALRESVFCVRVWASERMCSVREWESEFCERERESVFCETVWRMTCWCA